MTDPLVIAKSTADVAIFPDMINRHGLIAGATGTGKTVTLRVLVEHLSQIGVPVFLADVKGDLSGIAKPGGGNKKIEDRIQTLGLSGFAYKGYPVIFRDLFGQQGHPVRATISDMGPLLLSRILDLNDTQEGVLSIAFRIADDNGLLLLDMKDLRAMLSYVADHASEIKTRYGNVSTSSIGAIQRSLLTLEDQGGDIFFGEPALDINDMIQASEGKGIINLFAAQRLIQTPRIYATFLLWLLSELFENLPETGDQEKPKFVFFFDEAHLLFKDTPKAFEEKIVQIVRLIRSKGVGIFFITQSPSDIPDDVLSQLGNKIHHALRVTTPREEKAVKTAAQSLRANPAFDTQTAITELGIGEALVSVLDRKGIPTPVERALIVPPTSRLTPLTSEECAEIIAKSPQAGKYEKTVDRVSAYEKLTERIEQKTISAEEPKIENQRKTSPSPMNRAPQGRQRKEDTPADIAGDIAISVVRTIGTQVGRELVRGILGSLGGTKKR